MSKNTKLDLLVISAHPDDAEVAAGGTLLHHIALGKKVGLLDLTKGELGTRGNATLRTHEANEAAQRLGATLRTQLDLPDGFFLPNEDNLLKIITQIRKYQPEIILTTATDDRHPDHARAAQMVVQASFLANLSKIETFEQNKKQAVWKTKLIYHFIQDKVCSADFVIDISPYIDKKFEVIKAYKSQFYDPLSNELETPITCKGFFEAIRGKNAALGRQIGVEYAEAFTVQRTIGIKNLFDLI
jgi:bacillithiol biosynthesis deacetylase BshB1